jgi:hypothetical protein
MTISIRPSTLPDIPSLVDIYLSSTRPSAFFTQVFPDVPPVRTWFVNMLSHEVRNETNARFLTAVDDNDDQEEEQIIAFAKWVWVDSAAEQENDHDHDHEHQEGKKGNGVAGGQ